MVADFSIYWYQRDFKYGYGYNQSQSQIFQPTELFEEDVLKSFVRHKFLPGVKDGEDVVGVLGPDTAGLEEDLHLSEVLALLKQRYSVVLTSKTNISL